MAPLVMVSPVGFERWKIVAATRAVAPARLVMIHTDHERAVRNAMGARTELSSPGLTVESHQVKGAFDFVEWFQVFDRIVGSFKGQQVIVNLTASHGVALSMAALVAAMRSIPCVCFDKEEGKLHHVSPGVLLHLQALERTDKALLKALATREMGVTEAASEAGGLELTTASAALKRLHERGFLGRREEGRAVLYSLREGVREFLGSILVSS